MIPCTFASIRNSRTAENASLSICPSGLSGVIAGAETRGAGIEIRIYGADPDEIEARARNEGHIVLAGSADKPHGLRECHVVGPEGYVFVPSRAIGG